MTLIFDSIVKSENSLPESPEISRGFSLAPHQSLSWQGVNRSAIRRNGKGSFKSKESGGWRRAKLFCRQMTECFFMREGTVDPY
jgi:hypothetical protein